MKKLFFGLLGTVALTATISAAPVVCGSAGNTFLDYKTNVAYADGCIQSDKIYDNFIDVAPALAIPDNWTVVMSEDVADLHLINFSKGSGGTAAVGPAVYAVSYTVSVDPDFLNKFIDSVNVSIDANGAAGSSTNKLIYDINANQLASVTSFGAAVTQALVPVQWIRVVETLTLTNGAALQSFSDSYRQLDTNNPTVPEPATYGMMGLGLAALGLIARRKKA